MSNDIAVLLAEMQAEFVHELPARCNSLEEGVLALESAEPGAFDELYRQIHSLKGSGGMFGISIVTTICHQFESFISATKKSLDRQAASTALAYVDLLRKTIPDKGRDAKGVAVIEAALEEMRLTGLSGRASVLIIEPSEAVRRLYKEALSDKSIQLDMMETGMAALGRMLHEPFDLLVISRELPDLNAIAVVAALRESRCRNSDIAVILVSSNPLPVPSHLNIGGIVRRDPQLMPTLAQRMREMLVKR